jgi:hypothetical protein
LEANATEIVVQCGSFKCGAAGIWEKVGNVWQVCTIAYSLKHMAGDGMQATETAVQAGTLQLPMRLGYLGHESTCHSPTQFTQTLAGMRDVVSQVPRSGYLNMAGLHKFSFASASCTSQAWLHLCFEPEGGEPEEGRVTTAA